MLSKINKINELTKFLGFTFNKKNFTDIDSFQLNDFPKLNIDDIKNKITLGTYQLKQCFSYLGEHLNRNNGKYSVKIFNENLNTTETKYKIIAAEIQSRHMNKTKYKIFIRYEPNINLISGITGWACSCKSGIRTCGCCSHIASIIYYFSYGKYLDTPIPNPGKTLNNFLIIPTLESDSEEENQVQETQKTQTGPLSCQNSPDTSQAHIDSGIFNLDASLKRNLSLDNFQSESQRLKKKFYYKNESIF